MNRNFVILLIVVLAGYLATGLFQVAPGEWAVVRRCGQALPELRGPGLHVGFPWGIDQVDRVAVDEQRQLTIGYQDDAGPGDSLAPITQTSPSGQVLTGDNQIVNLRISIHYRVERTRLVDFVMARQYVEELLTRSADATLTRTVAGEKIDQVLLGRAIALEVRLRDHLAATIRDYRLGIIIDSVNIALAQPPAELIDIFRDVNRARSQRDISLTDAHAKKNADISQARQHAEMVMMNGSANAKTRLVAARSEADSFRSLLATFPKAEPAASAALLQLYLSEMQGIMARMQVRTLSDQGVEQVVIVPLPGK